MVISVQITKKNTVKTEFILLLSQDKMRIN